MAASPPIVADVGDVLVLDSAFLQEEIDVVCVFLNKR
jgi:hypothetical protein